MKRTMSGLLLVFLGWRNVLAAQDPQELYNQALIQERAAGNLQQAIQLYQRAARESSGDRALAAEALMSAARACEKLGQTEASRSLYAEIVRVYPEQREQVSTANQRLGETGIVQGAVSRSGNREPISGAKITLSKVTLSGGPVDPEAFNQLQNFFKARGLEGVTPS